MNFDSDSQNQPTSWAMDSGMPAKPAKQASTRMREKAAEEAGERLAAEMKVFNQVAEELKARRNTQLPTAMRRKLVIELAAELFGVAPTWTAFYRETIGGTGLVRALFETPEDMREYENSEEHAKVMDMLTILRSRDLPENDPHEPQRMITVRMPKSLHDAICDEANTLAVSVNKLCISRMLQRLDAAMIPSSTQRRRGRRPGASTSTDKEPATTETESQSVME